MAISAGDAAPKIWWLKDLGVEAFGKDLGSSIPKHSHDDWQIARGIDRWWHGHVHHAARPGSLVIVGPGEVHATDAPSGAAWRVSNFRIPDLAFRGVAEVEGFRGNDPAAGLSIIEDSRLIAWFAMLWEVATGSATSLERSSALNGLVTAWLTQGGPQAPNVATEPRAVARAREFLHAYPAEEVSLADLAQVAGLSPYRLNRAFRRAVGVPPHAYQVQLRMRKARTLLLEGMPIAEAAGSAGFADQSHLGRYFRRFGGVSPGEYRRVARSSSAKAGAGQYRSKPGPLPGRTYKAAVSCATPPAIFPPRPKACSGRDGPHHPGDDPMHRKPLTAPGALPPKPQIRKIAFEEHFLVPVAMKKDKDGNIDQQDVDYHAVENGLTPDWFKQIYDRMLDFTEARIESMDAAGIDLSLLSLMCPGIQGVTDAKQAQDMARAVNDALAEVIAANPTRFAGMASLAAHDPDAAARELER